MPVRGRGGRAAPRRAPSSFLRERLRGGGIQSVTGWFNPLSPKMWLDVCFKKIIIIEITMGGEAVARAAAGKPGRKHHRGPQNGEKFPQTPGGGGGEEGLNLLPPTKFWLQNLGQAGRAGRWPSPSDAAVRPPRGAASKSPRDAGLRSGGLGGVCVWVFLGGRERGCPAGPLPARCVVRGRAAARRRRHSAAPFRGGSVTSRRGAGAPRDVTARFGGLDPRTPGPSRRGDGGPSRRQTPVGLGRFVPPLPSSPPGSPHFSPAKPRSRSVSCPSPPPPSGRCPGKGGTPPPSSPAGAAPHRCLSPQDDGQAARPAAPQ